MKKTILFALTALVFIFLPSSKLVAQATIEDEHAEEDYSDVFVTCEGKPIDIQAHNVFDWHVVTSKNRTIISASLRGTLTGVDQNGITYEGLQHSFYNFQIPVLASDLFSQHLRQTFHLVSKGSAPDVRGHYTYKITVNGNGEVVVEGESFTIDCN